MAVPTIPNTNLSQYYQDPALEQARAAGETTAAQAAQYTSAGSLLPYKLKDAILQKLNYNQDLIQQQATAQAKYFQAPSQARVQYQNVWNPQEREALVTQYRTQQYQPYATLTDLLAQRMGSISNIIGAGTASFKSLADLAGAEAERARQKYVDLFSRAQTLTGTLTAQDKRAREEAWAAYNAAETARKWAAEMAQRQTEFNKTQELQRKQIEAGGWS